MTSRFELLTAEEMRQLPEPSWLIDGLLMHDTMAVLHGEAGAFKTFVALD